VPYYEGRVGASAREIKGILHDAAQNPEFPCLSPLTVFQELEQFIKRVSEYEFLKQDVRDGYHDAYEFINTVRTDYLSTLDTEVRESMGIFERAQYEDYIKKYITQLSPLLKGEKIKNPITGRMESADESMLEEFEKIVEAPQGGRDREIFRQNVITAIGAYSLDNPNQPVKYRVVFPEFMTKLENHYFEQQRSQMGGINNALTLFGTDKEDRDSDAAKLARRTMENMVGQFGYCEHCAKNSLMFLIKSRY
jgi:predicted Ser/Thr protein kinase